MFSRIKMSANVCFVALLMIFASYSWAQTTSSKTDTQKSSMSPDSKFAKEASSGGMAEVKLGQLAQEKGTNDAVKKFGGRMVNDHTKSGENLKAAASQANMTLPDKMSSKDQDMYNRLSKMSGESFDREYAKEMVTDHTHDVSEFRKEATNGQEESIKNFASQTLPTLQEHLKQAREMEKAVSGSAAANSKINGSY